MSVSFVATQHGIQMPTNQQQSLANMLSSSNTSIVIDGSEGEGRTLESVASFIQAGGVWVSWGGYPFYYTPSQPGGSGSNFSRMCKLLGVPDPSTLTGSEFFGPNGTRQLNTKTATLPSPWIAGNSSTFSAYSATDETWNLIGVPSGAGWWFYASSSVTPQQYASFILSLITPQTASATVNSGSIAHSTSSQPLSYNLTPLWIVAGLAAAGITVALVVHARQAR